MKAQAKPFTPPSSLPLMTPASGTTSRDDCKNPVVYEIKVYDWEYTSSCGSVLYRESDRQFYTWVGAEKDAQKYDFDFPDSWRYDLKVVDSTQKMECNLTPAELCDRLFIKFLWNYIHKEMQSNCFGCKVNHPSELQHLENGCLTDITETDVSSCFTPAITSIIRGSHVPHELM